jgi:hypothetical protein
MNDDDYIVLLYRRYCQLRKLRWVGYVVRFDKQKTCSAFYYGTLRVKQDPFEGTGIGGKMVSEEIEVEY